MNDDELAMRTETASAYLDGELDAAQHEAAAADAATMSLVDSFAQVRATLADVGPVDEDARSSAITAALAEFDARQAAAPIAAGAVATVTPLQRRRMRSYRFVAGFAAAALVGVVAVAALNSTGDDSNPSSANEAVVPLGAATVDSPQTPALKVGDTQAAATEAVTLPVAAGSAADSSATIVPAVDSPADLTVYAASINGDATAAGAPAATETPATSAAAATGATAATTTEPAPGSPVPAAASAYQTPACMPLYDTVLGAVTVKGAPAFVVRDTSADMLRAVDAANCQVFFSIAAP